MPVEVHELCEALQQAPEAPVETKETDSVQIRRVIGGDRFPVLIRGFLVPDLTNELEPRFLVLMEKMGRRSQVPTMEAKSHFHLTDREYEIVTYVAEGGTNKEIAEVLEISEHTVKEHIKHILRKTHVIIDDQDTEIPSGLTWVPCSIRLQQLRAQLFCFHIHIQQMA